MTVLLRIAECHIKKDRYSCRLVEIRIEKLNGLQLVKLLLGLD